MYLYIYIYFCFCVRSFWCNGMFVSFSHRCLQGLSCSCVLVDKTGIFHKFPGKVIWDIYTHLNIGKIDEHLTFLCVCVGLCWYLISTFLMSICLLPMFRFCLISAPKVVFWHGPDVDGIWNSEIRYHISIVNASFDHWYIYICICYVYNLICMFTCIFNMYF